MNQKKIKIPKSYFKKFKTRKYSSSGPLSGNLKRYFINNFICHITEIFKAISPKTVMELGCGEGFVCGWLSSQFKDVRFSGVDINEDDLNLLQKLFPHITTYNFDLLNIENTPVLKEHFDLVLCMETLEHLKNPENFLLKLKQLNCDNLIITVPWEPFFQISNFIRGQNLKNFGNDPEHINHWNNKQFIKLLLNDFVIYKNTISFPWQIVWLKK